MAKEFRLEGYGAGSLYAWFVALPGNLWWDVTANDWVLWFTFANDLPNGQPCTSESSGSYDSGTKLADLPATPPSGTVTVRAFLAPNLSLSANFVAGVANWTGYADYYVALPTDTAAALTAAGLSPTSGLPVVQVPDVINLARLLSQQSCPLAVACSGGTYGGLVLSLFAFQSGIIDGPVTYLACGGEGIWLIYITSGEYETAWVLASSPDGSFPLAFGLGSFTPSGSNTPVGVYTTIADGSTFTISAIPLPTDAATALAAYGAATSTELTDAEAAIIAAIADTSPGSGAHSTPIGPYETSVGQLLYGVQVTMWNDVGMTSQVAGTGTVITGGNGVSIFNLNSGTYYAKAILTGFTFTNPQTIVVP